MRKCVFPHLECPARGDSRAGRCHPAPRAHGRRCRWKPRVDVKTESASQLPRPWRASFPLAPRSPAAARRGPGPVLLVARPPHLVLSRMFCAPGSGPPSPAVRIEAITAYGFQTDVSGASTKARCTRCTASRDPPPRPHREPCPVAGCGRWWTREPPAGGGAGATPGRRSGLHALPAAALGMPHAGSAGPAGVGSARCPRPLDPPT